MPLLHQKFLKDKNYIYIYLGNFTKQKTFLCVDPLMTYEMTSFQRSNFRRHTRKYTENAISMLPRNKIWWFIWWYTLNILYQCKFCTEILCLRVIYTGKRPCTLEGSHTYVIIVISVSSLFKAMKRLTNLT